MTMQSGHAKRIKKTSSTDPQEECGSLSLVVPGRIAQRIRVFTAGKWGTSNRQISYSQDPEASLNLGQPLTSKSVSLGECDDSNKKSDLNVVNIGTYKGFPCIGNPKSYLEIKPLPSSTGGYRPEFTLDRFDIDDLSVGIVSLRGMSHQCFGTPRQDAAAYRITRDGRYLIFAIADGISQGKLSQVGADYVVKQALRITENILSMSIEENALRSVDWAAVEESVRNRLLEQAKELERQGLFSVEGAASPGTYAQIIGTTAEVLIVKRNISSCGSHEFVRVVLSGDGSGYKLDKSNGWSILSLGKLNNTGLATNAVTPLPIKAEGYPSVQYGKICSGQMVMVVTDGIGDMGIGSGNAASCYFQRVLSEPLSAHDLLTTFSLVENQKDDDRTAVIVWAS